MKKCCHCKQEKYKKDFFKNKKTKDGLNGRCRECESLRKKIFFEKNTEKVRKQKRENMSKLRNQKKQYRITEYLEPGTRKCTKCKTIKHLIMFGKNKKGKEGLHFWCKACCSQLVRN